MRPKRSARKPARQRPAMIRRDAAGIDIGARSIHVAGDPDRDPRPVREFQMFTQDLYALADWLQACGVRTVADGVDRSVLDPLFQILEARGFEVCLVTARHVTCPAERRIQPLH
jgi:transposase